VYNGIEHSLMGGSSPRNFATWREVKRKEKRMALLATHCTATELSTAMVAARCATLRTNEKKEWP
jgi:hypothetical protein